MNSISRGQYSHLFIVYEFLAAWVNPYNDRLGNQGHDTELSDFSFLAEGCREKKALLNNPWKTHKKRY